MAPEKPPRHRILTLDSIALLLAWSGLVVADRFIRFEAWPLVAGLVLLGQRATRYLRGQKLTREDEGPIFVGIGFLTFALVMVFDRTLVKWAIVAAILVPVSIWTAWIAVREVNANKER